MLVDRGGMKLALRVYAPYGQKATLVVYEWVVFKCVCVGGGGVECM